MRSDNWPSRRKTVKTSSLVMELDESELGQLEAVYQMERVLLDWSKLSFACAARLERQENQGQQARRRGTSLAPDNSDAEDASSVEEEEEGDGDLAQVGEMRGSVDFGANDKGEEEDEVDCLLERASMVARDRDFMLADARQWKSSDYRTMRIGKWSFLILPVGFCENDNALGDAYRTMLTQRKVMLTPDLERVAASLDGFGWEHIKHRYGSRRLVVIELLGEHGVWALPLPRGIGFDVVKTDITDWISAVFVELVNGGLVGEGIRLG